MKKHISGIHFLLTAGLLLAAWVAQVAPAGGEGRFISASPATAARTDGTPLPAGTEALGWKWNSGVGNGGVWETCASDVPFSEILMFKVDGLEPGAVYEVFGYFWADGFDGVEVKERQFLPAQFGCTLAELQTYEGPTPHTDDKVGSWMVAPGVNTGDAYGYHAVIEEQMPLTSLDKKLKFVDGGARLVRARMGLSRADKSGALPVFFAGYPYAKSLAGVSRIDGVAVRKLEHKGPLEMGWKAETRLHLAIRAGDPVTVQRELEAGANVNVFDEENLTPLFHACGAGDVGLAKKLIENGADPNLAGQSVLPLAVAAMTADEVLVRALLDAGAKVPTELAKNSGRLANGIHPAMIHPVIVAIRARSVPVLRLLLEHAPGLKISELYPSSRDGNTLPDQPRSPSPNFVLEAILDQQWEMAEFLLEHGCKPGDGMAGHCMRAGEVGNKLLDVLIKRGVPLVKQIKYSGWDQIGYSAASEGFSGLQVEDALTTAVVMGRVDLVRRLLPMAEGLRAYNHDLLMTFAMVGGNQEIMEMIRRKFPKVAPARWKPRESESIVAASEETLRLFLPRTRPPVQPKPGAADGGHVLAILSSPEAQGPGAALAAAASATDGWTVVDRELVEEALVEGKFAKPWQKGEYRMAELGDRISADSIIIVSKIQGEKFSVYAFEVVEVATGLVVHREHVADNEMKMESDFAGLLERAQGVLDAAAESKRHEAVTLLAFTARGELPDEMSLARQLRVAVQRQIDESPGMISLTRQQTNRLVDEQALQGQGRIWSAAHMVEGAVSPADGGRVKVALRLETFEGDDSVKVDAEAEGGAHELPALAAAAWRKLFSHAPVVVSADERSAEQVKKDGLKEAARLLREAEWLIHVQPDPEAVLPMVETAAALGAPLEEVMPLHLDILFRRISSLSMNSYSRKNTQGLMAMSWYPVLRMDVADRLAHDLPKARELLEQTASYLTLHGEYIFKHEADRKGEGWKLQRCLWQYMEALLIMRVWLHPHLMESAQRQEFAYFERELDDMARQYFAMRKSMGLRLDSRHIINFDVSLLLSRNPGFKEGWLQMFEEVFKDAHNQLPDFHEPGWIGVQEMIMERLDKTPERDLTDEQRLIRAAVRCGVGDGRTGRDALLGWIALAHETLVRGEVNGVPLSNSSICNIERLSTGYWFQMYAPRHGASLIPSLVHNPRMVADFRMRWLAYMQTAATRNALRDGREAFERRVRSKDKDYMSHYRQMAEKLNKSDGKPGLVQTLEAARLMRLIGGHNGLESLTREFASLLMPSAPGSQPPPVLVAGRIADFRVGDPKRPGAIRYPFVDSANPDILWMFYFSSVLRPLDGRMCAKGLGTDYDEGWLIAMDSSNGRVVHRINLQQAVREGLGRPLSITALECPNSYAFHAQTDDYVMLNVMGNAGRDFTVCLVIDKKSGKAKALPAGTIMTLSRHWNAGSSAIGYGGHFYFFDDASMQDEGIHRDYDSIRRRSMFRLDPETMNLSMLVESGRRPAMTPFDDVDRQPYCMSEENGRLAVFNEKVFAYYDPGTGNWQLKNDHSEIHALRFGEEETRRHLDALIDLRVDGQSSGWRLGLRKPEPGTLRFEGKRSVMLPVVMEIPEDYRSNTWFSKQQRIASSVDVAMSFDDYFKVMWLTPQVISQTGDSMIFSMEVMNVGNGAAWLSSTRTPPQLPFLWKLSKKELMDRLNVQP